MSEGGQARRLARSTATFTLATGLSRVLGLVREIVAAYFFGVSGKINAFTVASQIPSLTRAFVGDAALSGAFPVFSELLAKEKGSSLARGVHDLLARPHRGLGAHGIPDPDRASHPPVRRPGGDPGSPCS